MNRKYGEEKANNADELNEKDFFRAFKAFTTVLIFVSFQSYQNTRTESVLKFSINSICSKFCLEKSLELVRKITKCYRKTPGKFHSTSLEKLTNSSDKLRNYSESFWEALKKFLYF